ncbi:MAG TPA: transcription elongation factor GreAB [Verrucomicrobiales bacterium]|nr:transcription elongation factor GreAB [Verrucomicrobiales bacterium]
MNKRQVINAVREELRRQFELLKRASDTAREDATDEESRARSKYDTQGLEASYLAAGQADRAEDLALAIQKLNAEPFLPYRSGDPIGEGALVEADIGGEREWFLLAPCAGGLSVKVGRREVTLLAPGAPLRKGLWGLAKGDRIEERQLLVRSVR